MMMLDDNLTLLPREKLLQLGAESLSDKELLAIFLRTGTRGVSVIDFAEQLINAFGSLHALMNASFEEIQKIKGIGVAKYTQIKAVIELSRRYFDTKIGYEDCLTNPHLTYSYLMHYLDNKEREVFVVLFLNNQNRVIVTKEMFVGTINRVEIHPREIIKEALKCNAASVILSHNHPSGDLVPSEADIAITKVIVESCMLIDVKVLDHIIIGQGYFSFAEKGLI